MQVEAEVEAEVAPAATMHQHHNNTSLRNSRVMVVLLLPVVMEAAVATLVHRHHNANSLPVAAPATVAVLLAGHDQHPRTHVRQRGNKSEHGT